MRDERGKSAARKARDRHLPAFGRHFVVIAVTILFSVEFSNEDLIEDSAITNITRRENGDTFIIPGAGCGPDKCLEWGGAGGGVRAGAGGACVCACPPRAPLYREDVSLCVDDVNECALATFGTGSSSQRIPFVFLPLKGQIIHPSKDITFPGVRTPICAVSGAQFLTRRGFADLRNTIDADVPFSLFRDEGRTFLQWAGEAELRSRMSGRLLLVRLLCRDVAAGVTGPGRGSSGLAGGGTSALSGVSDLHGVFTPCVAFRVQGSPAILVNNVSEVLFSPDARSSQNVSAPTTGLSVTEYVAIGVSSLLLGLIYVASVFLYLHIKKQKKKRERENPKKGLKGIRDLPLKRDIVIINNEMVQNLQTNFEEDGVIKSNPLLNMQRPFHDLKGLSPGLGRDSGSSFEDCERLDQNEEDEMNSQIQVISAIVHPDHNHSEMRSRERSPSRYPDSSHFGQFRDESGIERLPEENVSIIETVEGRDDKPEIVRAMGSTRRKLYFNPAYFEPHLLLEPPPAALEFLTKIREVITIAKHKMAAKRFQPVLNEIPEEETYQAQDTSLDFYHGIDSQRSSMISLKRENSRKRPMSCFGCPGCKSRSNGDISSSLLAYHGMACANCSSTRGDKQTSIKKWLENITPTSNYNEQAYTSGLLNSLLSLPMYDRESAKQQRFGNKTQSLLGEDRTNQFSFQKKTSTLSVQSEPPKRNYNFPLPDFGIYDCKHYHLGQTVAKIEDITPIGLSSYENFFLSKTAGKNKNPLQNNSMPDMINEALALDQGSQGPLQVSSDYEKAIGKPLLPARLDSLQNSPDDKQGVGYETDSLERSNDKGFSTPTDYADVPSSQASPSLSTALPLEEEMTMMNAVYKANSASPQNERKEQNEYETIGEVLAAKPVDKPRNIPFVRRTDDYSLVSEVYVNNSYNFGSTPTSPSSSECSMGSRKLGDIRYNKPNEPGRLTIIVKDPPENYIKIHESDGFEPDTLDRKHPKNRAILENGNFSRKNLINNIEAELTTPNNHNIQLKIPNSFKSMSLSYANNVGDAVQSNKPFSSLRDIYEYKNNTFNRPKLNTLLFTSNQKINDELEDHLNETIDWNSEEGRILTLELRHSKRQRQCTPPSIKLIKSQVQPDVIPPLPPVESTPIYEQPKPPRRVMQSKMAPPPLPAKNVNGRSPSSRRNVENSLDVQSSSGSTTLSSGPACSPSGASAKNYTNSSDYDIIHPVSDTLIPSYNKTLAECVRDKLLNDELSRKYIKTSTAKENSPKKNKNGMFFGNNLFQTVKKRVINTATYRQEEKQEIKPQSRLKERTNHKEDSGYLSSDSNQSQVPRRKIVIQKLEASDTDDTDNEAQSESGAESVETHSVFYGSFRKITMMAKQAEFNRNIEKLNDLTETTNHNLYLKSNKKTNNTNTIGQNDLLSRVCNTVQYKIG